MKKSIVLLGFILLANISYADDGFYMYCTQDSNQQMKCEPIQNVINTTNPQNQQDDVNQQSNQQSQYYKTRTAVQNASGTINDISNTIYSLRSMLDTINNF